MCYFQQSNSSQRGYLGFVRGDGWRGFEGFSFSWLGADWIIHGHPTGSWAACETHFTRLRCLTAAMPSFHPWQNQSWWLPPLQNRHTVWWGKLCWLCFNQDEWEIPNTELYFAGVWEVGGRVNKGWTKPSRKCSPNGIFDTRASVSIHKDNGNRSSKLYMDKNTHFSAKLFEKQTLNPSNRFSAWIL